LNALNASGAELHAALLAQRLERPILAQGEIERMQAGRNQRVRRRIAVMAKLRVNGDVAVCAS